MAPRTMLYTGKGGVGKTSVAAATARRTAAAGLRTLLVSTDPAHSLADVLDAPVGPDPTAVAPDLWAQELDAQLLLERAGAPRDWLAGLLGGGETAVTPDALTVPPGLDELLRLLALGRHFDDDAHDVLVVDCAATGETLRLLAFPDLARRLLQRIESGRTADPGERGGAGADRAGGADLLRELVALNEILTDHEHVTVRLVMTPDRVGLREARGTLTHLALHGHRTDAVVVNRVIPDDAGPYFAGWRARQAEQLTAIRTAFPRVPVLCSPLAPDEVVGAPALDALGDVLFAAHDPAAVLAGGQTQELVLTRDGATLRLDLPFATPQDVQLTQVGLELVVRTGGHRRALALPPALADYRPREATVRDGALLVDFDRLPHAVPDA